MENSGLPLLVLAAGGTGGHIYPALSLADEWKKRGGTAMIFTDPRGEPYITKHSPELPQDVLPLIAPLGSVFNKVRAGVSLIKATIIALKKLNTLKKSHPKIVTVAFGGYPCAPTVVASILLKIPYILQEQNAILGRANRVMAGFAQRVALGFPSSRVLPSKYIVTGNPVRLEITAIGQKPYRTPEQDEQIRILVLGGSQGAKVFGHVIPEALRLLPDDFQKRLWVDLQVRPEYLTETQAATATLSAQVNIQPFFEDVADRLKAAHLVICRAGASTTSEVLAARRPAIFVPYTQAIDDHQTANSKAALEIGASMGIQNWLIPEDHLTPETLAAKLTEIFSASTKTAVPTAISDSVPTLKDTIHTIPSATTRLANLMVDVVQSEA